MPNDGCGARLSSVTGNVAVTYSSKGVPSFSYEGGIILRSIGLSNNAAGKLYVISQMTISGKGDTWSLTSDGTEAHTVIDGKDSQITKLVQATRPEMLPYLLTHPQQFLLDAFRDDLCPSSRFTFEEISRVWGPWLVKGPKDGAKSSFAFLDIQGNFPAISFRNGHLAAWHSQGSAKTGLPSVTYDHPVLSDGFWFPTQIHARINDQTFDMALSDIAVKVAD